MKALTLADLFTPENSGETYVKIAKYREAEQQITELKELLQKVIDCPYTLDKATIPKDKNLNNLQVVGQISMAYLKREGLKQALKNGSI